jgi:hypothetical protein
MKGGFILGIGIIVIIIVLFMLLLVVVCTSPANKGEFYCQPFLPVVEIVETIL